MPVSFPPLEALKEFTGATTRHIRRVEIFEQDGTTRWEKDTVSRLKGGSVSVDYSRDERRALDLLLSNDDGVLINAPGEFWYDKILKVFRGVQVNGSKRQPKILIASDLTGTAVQGPSLRAALLELGFGDIQINTLAADYLVDVDPFDIIIALGDDDKGQLLKRAYDTGKTVFVFHKSAELFYNALQGNTTWAAASTAITAGTPLQSRRVNDPRNIGWSSFLPIADTTNYKAPAVGVTGIYGPVYVPGGETHYAVTSGTNSVGGKFVAVHYPVNAYQYQEYDFRQFLLAQMNWLNPVQALTRWEVQVGEFMIDRISEPNFPHEVKITGRDYTKKCLLSKYVEATQYAAGATLESIIDSIAVGSGVTKRLMPVTGVTVARSFFFERGTSRWEAMKEIATAYNHEIFFDATGYLVLRAFRDPSATAPVVYIQTGKQGQIASYEKSTSDASLFNHVLVIGESSDSSIPPVWAEAKNIDPNSPTSIAEIGDRYIEITSALVTTTAQAQALADATLAVSQLEEFELSFESLIMPWLEAGDILGWIDPNPAPGDPTTFLMSNFDIPLDLAPMSGSGRRVTRVGA